MLYEKDWDEEIGLWTGVRPHTRRICHVERPHPAPDAACRLLLAAQEGVLRSLQVKTVLKNLRSMVWTEKGPLFGCMRWYWEESSPDDTNAAFFTALPLIGLRVVYAEELRPGELFDLDWILDRMFHWFLYKCGGRYEYYPNAYLGDLVCGWLINEYLAKEEDGIITDAMRRAGKYWRGEGRWGWGEHLGQYINIILDQLSLLLLLGKKLPEDIRSDYLEMLNELLSLQDKFGDGPQVPALRSYYFTRAPEKIQPYREYVRETGPGEQPLTGNRIKMPGLLAQLGWHELVSPPSGGNTFPSEFRVPCAFGADAFSYVDRDIRLGGMSRFPLMEWAESSRSGLSWQCFPVCLWRPGGDWGFLFWQADEKGVCRSHPMGCDNSPEIPRQLTDSVTPPIVGRTASLMFGCELFSVRLMPARPASWESFSDGFRIIHTYAKPEIKNTGKCFVKAVFSWDDRRVSVEFLNMTDDRLPVLCRNEYGGYDLIVHYDLTNEGPVLGLWRINLSPRGDEAPPRVLPADVPAQPRFGARGAARRVLWAGRGLLVDPLSPAILKDREYPGL